MSDTPSTSSVLNRESAPRLSQHLEELDAPLPTFDDLFMTPSNQPTRATSPTEGDFTQMLTSKEQEEADEVITKSLKSIRMLMKKKIIKEHKDSLIQKIKVISLSSPV